MQVEYATDIIFKTQQGLSSIYEGLIRTAIHAVKVDHIATFLGHKVDGRFSGELGTDFQTRILGTRIKHFLRDIAIKMYDKFGLVLRIETTSNNVSFFPHHRKVEHRDGTSEFKVALQSACPPPSHEGIEPPLPGVHFRARSLLSGSPPPHQDCRDVSPKGPHLSRLQRSLRH